MKNYPQELFEKFLSPFSGHTLEYKGVLYTTLEHAYHCQRYTNPNIIEEIKSARSAFLAWETSQKYKSFQIPDFDNLKISVMENLFRAKLDHHKDIRQALEESKEMTIVKHLRDAFWGDGLDGSGRNEMGKIWMKLRAELKS